MRVVVDFTSAIGDRTGVGTYTREITRAHLRSGEIEHLRLAVHAFRQTGWRRRMNRQLEGLPDRWRAVPNRLVPPRVVLEANRLIGPPSVETLFGSCDVFHGPNFVAPPGRRCRTVVTVHDLAFVRFRDEIPVPHRYVRYIGGALGRADRVIAVSRATADDAIDLFGIRPEKVEVVHEGAPERLPTLGAEEFRAERERREIPERFFLFVGTLEPRKNLRRLVAAWRTLADRHRHPPGLVLAGRTGWHCREIHEAIADARRTLPVVHVGFVPERLRNSLYANCLAFVLPSLYEGFGLPLVEAFAAGAPAICSDAGALPEVAGGAALLVDPTSETGLTAALRRMNEDGELRRDLAAKGRERAGAFTWDRAAAETRGVYASAVEGPELYGRA